MTTPKAVFWDMDGTLIDSEPLHERSLVSVLRSLGVTPPVDLHQRVVGVAAQQIFEMIVTEHHLTISFADWIEQKYAHYLAHLGELYPRPGAVEIYRDLDALGVAQVIVSNSDRLVVEANMRVIGVSRPTGKSIARNDVRNPKPHAEAYLRAAYLADANPVDCAVVEDSLAGAMAGVAAGMRTYVWSSEPLTPPAGAVLVSTAAELRRHLGLSPTV
jgi:HAD superfamily hydrolase (TIGR01509 family)